MTKPSKRPPPIPNGLSEEEGDSSESEDERKVVKNIVSKQTTLSEPSVSSSPSSSEDSASEEFFHSRRSSKKKKKLHWAKKGFKPSPADFAGSFPPPPLQRLDPIDYFLSMFGEESITLLTNQSNLYSVQKDPNKPLNTTEYEMRRFIGVLLMTGIYSFPQQRFFWMSGTRVESISSAMTRDRFLQMKKYLHVVDNSSQSDPTDPDFDRAHKVRPLLEIVKDNFRSIPKEEKLSADEQIIPFKGRSIMKQYMPQKPNRWGYKMFLLAGGASGICYDFILFTGKQGGSQHGFCTDIVLQLCETVPRSLNHKLYCDNYYTTIRLFVELFKLGVSATGAIRSNRLQGLMMKNEKELTKEGRGSMDHRVAEVNGVELCVTRWFDNSTVNVLSTLHGCDPINPVQRWSKKEKKYVQVTQPEVVRQYNLHMGGVDLMDMLLSLYRINVRSQKYYIKIIFHLIDLSLVNAWLLYRRHCSQLSVPKRDTMSLLLFRINVAQALLQATPPPPLPRGRDRPSSDSVNKEISLQKLPRATPKQVPPKNIRFDKYDHWPICEEKGRCRRPGCPGYTTVSCSKCKIRLCLNDRRNCFKSYHNQ